MKTVLLAFLTLLLFPVSSSAQFVWQKTYGPLNSMNSLTRMIPLKNGGYLLVGSQLLAGSPFQGTSTYVVRTNATGDTLWTRKYRPVVCEACNIYDAAEDHDGNFVLVGGGSIYVGGLPDYNGFLYKLNSNGDTLWTKKIITPQSDRFSNVIIGHDSSYLVTAEIAGTNYLQKRNKNGTVRWSRAYPFSLSGPGWIGYVHPAPTGYFVFVHSGFNETKIYKIDENGTEQYSKKNKAGMIFDVATDANQNILVCGDGRLYKLNPAGDTLWSQLYKRNNQYIGIDAVRSTADGNYIMLFGTYGFQDIGFMKVDPNGILIKDTVLYRSGSDYAKDIVLDANGNYVLAAYSNLQNGSVFFLGKYRKWNQLVGINEEKELASGIKLYPNPASDQTTIESVKPLTGTFSLYSLQGQDLWRETVSKTAKKVVPLQNLPPGIYILRFVSENGTQFSRKLIKR